jgi:hypothetical protein
MERDRMKKILALGISQSNFLNQLYGDLINKDSAFSIDIDGYFDISGKENEDTIYSHHLNLKKTKISKGQLYKSFFSFVRTSLFWEIVFFELSQKTSLRSIKKIAFSYAWSKAIVETQILSKGYDICHFHFCTPENLKFLHFFPKDINTVCSFWGSDLLRITGTANVFYVSKALSRATTITIQSRELAETIYCKYGRELSDKTKIVQFTIHTGIYKKIDLYRNDIVALDNFKRQNNIPIDRKIICVSHNAYDANNHLSIIEGILNLPKEFKNQIAIVLPLAYGREKKYLAALDACINSIKDIPVIKLEAFLDSTQASLLRLSSEVMIQMPITDALSGAMTEVLYAGNHVIAGSWLPYGILRRQGVHFDEADTFDGITPMLSRYLHRPENWGQINKDNGLKIKSFLFPEKTTSDWRDIFNSLINSDRKIFQNRGHLQ